MTDSLTPRVIADAGFKPSEDFKLTDEQYSTLIDGYLTSTKDFLTSYLNRTYTAYPEGLNQIIVEIVCNILRNKSIRQSDPVNTDDEATPLYIGRTLTTDIQLRLKPYIKRQSIRVFGV